MFTIGRRKPQVDTDRICFEGDYPDFEAAKAACRGSEGYESSEAVGHYVKRYQEVVADPAGNIERATEQVARFMTAFSLAEPINGIYEVYDFGGGYGAIYELFRYLYPGKRFRWTIAEVPAIVARGNEMGASEDKRFVTELPPGRYSFGISSGTLQCLPLPREGLSQMLATDTGITFVNRFPIVPSLTRDRLTVEHVPASRFAASFPTWFFAGQWTTTLSALGRQVMRWDAPGDVTELDGERFNYQAFVFGR